jgi:glycine hydroxymethyltransferase
MGTPAITTRGMQEPEMETIAELITVVLEKSRHDNEVIRHVRQKVRELCEAFPVH